jgi:hypothetical protein
MGWVLGIASLAAGVAGCGEATATPNPGVMGGIGSSLPFDAGVVRDVVTGGGSSASLDAGRATDVVGTGESSVPFDAATPVTGPGDVVGLAWDPPFTGRRAFAVTTQLQISDGAGGGRTDFHRFTMVLDAERPVAILGVDAGGTTAALVQTGTNTFHFVGTVSIPTFQWGGCPTGAFDYDDFTFTLTAAGELEGGGHGQSITVIGGVSSTFSAPMTLVGVPDTVGPLLGLYAYSELSHPLTYFTVISSEPLPLDPPLVLRGTGGDSIVLNPVPGDVGIVFEKPKVMLRFGETYTVDTARVTDFAGNPSTVDGSVSFGTRAAPPLLAEDGFESLPGESLLSNAQVLSPSGAPILSGARSLYLYPNSASGMSETQFAVRLAIAPGDRVLRFSYRTVSTSASGGDDAEFVVATPGGPITSAVLPASGTRTPARIYVDDVMLGPLTTATIDLPADAAGEVVLARVFANLICESPVSDPVGFIIDDLRAE